MNPEDGLLKVETCGCCFHIKIDVLVEGYIGLFIEYSEVSRGKMTGILLDANFENSKEKEYLEVCLCKLIFVLDL